MYSCTGFHKNIYNIQYKSKELEKHCTKDSCHLCIKISLSLSAASLNNFLVDLKYFRHYSIELGHNSTTRSQILFLNFI